MKKRIIILWCIPFIFCADTFAQTRAFEMNSRLGMGINLGNVFEAPALGAWNIDVDASYIEEIKAKGFSSIRIPARWSAHADGEAPYTIHPYFMDTVKWAINLALANDLTVVLNIHHYEEMMKKPEIHKARFLALWKQIANEFQHYPDNLYFELFNEPSGNFTPELWNEYLVEGLHVVREKNPDRMVIIGTAEWGGVGGLSKLVLPDDPNIILTIHYYEPFNFTHQGADWTGQNLPTGVTWNGTATQINAITQDMTKIKQYSETHNVPVYIGEFGAIEYADDDSRTRWIGQLQSMFEEYGFSGSYWEFCSGFGIYDPVLACYRTGMLQALTGFEGADDCSRFDSIIVKNSSFDKSIRPWVFNLFPDSGAEAEIAVVDGEARIEILNKGTESWHIQFLYSSFPLIRGNTYTFTFDAYASSPTSVDAMINRDGGNWETALFLKTGLTIEKKTFSHTFTYNDETMERTRIAFDCAFADAQYLYFDNVHLYEKVPETSVKDIGNSSKCTVKIDGKNFPVDGNAMEMLTICDIYGRVHYQKTYPHVESIEIENVHLPLGIGLIRIQTDKGITTIKKLN